MKDLRNHNILVVGSSNTDMVIKTNHLPRPASGLLDTALNEVVIASLRLDDMEVVFAPACINVGVTGVLFFLSFVMGFQRPCWVALVLLKPQNCVLCHSAPFPIPFLSGVFHRENPAENSSDRIGMDRI